MLRFLSRRSARADEVEGTSCQWCRRVIRASVKQPVLPGAVLDPAAGWFCSSACAQQYAVRFRVQPRTPTGGTGPTTR
jgi:hypothetical protein